MNLFLRVFFLKKPMFSQDAMHPSARATRGGLLACLATAAALQPAQLKRSATQHAQPPRLVTLAWLAAALGPLPLFPNLTQLYRTPQNFKIFEKCQNVDIFLPLEGEGGSHPIQYLKSASIFRVCKTHFKSLSSFFKTKLQSSKSFLYFKILIWNFASRQSIPSSIHINQQFQDNHLISK